MMKRILLRSSWQTVNIGDIGHTPGVLRLLEQHLPDVEVRLWPSSVADGVAEMLRRRFPKVAIVQSPDAVKAALAECDLLLHGSGPSLVAEKDVDRWRRETGKPYGIYGITLAASPPPETVDVLSGARFAFFRDSVSLQHAKDARVACPILEFGPDGAFAADVRDDAAARTFLDRNRLDDGGFVCVIPRLRYTPYWTIPSKKAPFDPKRNDRNEAMKEHDHAPLRAAITAVARQTKFKVLICPEDQTQVAVGRAMLYDPLPDDVKAKVVWRDRYWLTDEAISTYVRSAGLFGLEMHSPILCVGNGVPAIVCRFAEQTSKGFMWRDIGLGDWLFDMDEPKDIARIAPAVLEMLEKPGSAKAKTETARRFVVQRQRETMAVVAKSL